MTNHYRNAKKPKPQKSPVKKSNPIESGQDNSLDFIEVFLSHSRSIDTLNSFLRLTPSEDEYHQVLVLIADQLNRTFLDVIPVFASSSAKSRGPTNTSQLQAR